MQRVADAIRKVTVIAQQRYDDGERSAASGIVRFGSG
jgi:hypothetical protein